MLGGFLIPVQTGLSTQGALPLCDFDELSQTLNALCINIFRDRFLHSGKLLYI